MRRLLVVIVLLSLMLFMRSFQAHTDASGNVITLAAIGFVVLATFAVADMGTRLSLPRVTGFIITGVALGPSAANILSREVVSEMRMFNTLALGLIATSAGLELNLKALLPLLRTHASTTVVKVLLGAPLVGFTLFGASHFIDLGVSSFESRAALAIVMGVLSIGTSPSIALAILTETKAKGRLSDLVLGAAVFKDLVVVVCLAIGVAAADAMLDSSGRADSSVLLHVSRELAGSLIAGGILGGILIAYVRFVQAEMLLFVAAMILVVAELCQAFHLELLLVFISAGFTVRNFSAYEHELMKPLELVALPVFVVFFTIAGASIHLAKAWAIVPAALAVCVVRAGIYWVAAAFGNAVGREPPVIRRNAWSAYLPQAGVTLGLVGVAAQKLPVLSTQITTTGMAIVAINLLVGPVTLRLALSRAGEIPGVRGEDEDRPSATHLPSAAADTARPQPGPEALPDALLNYVNHTQAAASAALATLWASQRTIAGGQATSEEPSPEERLAVVRAYRSAAKRLYENWVQGLSGLPVTLVVDQPLSELRPRRGDAPWLRVRLWWRWAGRVVFRRLRRRRVPVRLMARMSLELVVARAAVRSFDAALERHYAPTTSANNEAVSQRWEQEIAQAASEFSRLLSLADTPRLQRRALQFSAVEPQIRGELAQLDEGRDEFHAARAAALWGTEVARGHIATLSKTVHELLVAHLTSPARNAVAMTTSAITRLVNDLSELGRNMESSINADLVRAAQSELTVAHKRVAEALTHSVPRASHVVREMASAFRSDIDQLPAELRCYQQPLDGSARYGSIRRLELRDIAETHLIRRLIPTLDQSARGLSSIFAHLPREVKDCLEPAFLLLEAWSDDASGWAGIRQRIQASTSRLVTLRESVLYQVEEEIDRQEVATAATLDALEREFSTAPSAGETTSHRIRQLAGRLARGFQPLLNLRRHDPTHVLDARTLRQEISPWHHSGVDPVAAGWFSQQPVRDERIYSDTARVLDRVLQLEGSWREGNRVAVLVTGELGSGKTSLLNMCELELRSPRIFRLDAEGPEQALTLRETIAHLLGCRATEGAILYALAVQKPVLLVDNLPRWLTRGAEPIGELIDILAMIARTRETFWIVSIDPSLEERTSRLVTLSAPFTARIDVPPVTRRDIQAMVTSRAGRAKQEVRFRPTALGKLLEKLALTGDDLLYFADLERQSRGSPGRALALTLATAVGGDRHLVLDRRVLPPAVPSMGQRLSVSQLACLLVLLQHGPSDLHVLAQRIGSDATTAELDLSFLQSAGLVFVDNRAYAIEQAVRWVVADELERIGAVHLRGRPTRDEPRRLAQSSRWLVVASCVVTAGYVLLTGLQSAAWPQWAIVVGALLLLALPLVQNIAGGLVLRSFARLRPGDSLRAAGVSGLIRRLRLSHLELTSVTGRALFVPYKKVLASHMALQRGTQYGDQVRVVLPVEGATPAIHESISRAAYMCPYRMPGSPVHVDVRGQSAVVDFYSWHRDSAKRVEAYLGSHVASPGIEAPPSRPQD